MAKGATIYKCNLNIANMDSHYYEEHSLTMAKHPSESDLRLMIRLTTFALNASDTLEFTKGISQDDEPDVWAKDLSGDIDLWIDIGQPDEKRIRKACGRSQEVIIYNYLEGSALSWWKQAEKTLNRFKNLSVVFLKIEGDLETLTKRGMDIQCNISDGELTLIDEENSVAVRPEVWKEGI